MVFEFLIFCTLGQELACMNLSMHMAIYEIQSEFSAITENK